MKELADSLEGPLARSFDAVALAPVRQFNALALEILTRCARHPAWTGSAWEAALGANFGNLQPEVRLELAKSPIALLEFATSPFAADSACARDTGLPFLPGERALELAQLMLTLSWTFARQDPAAARVIFGLSVEDVSRFGRLDMRDIPRIAARTSVSLQPRWLDQPRIWQELLHHKVVVKDANIAPRHLRILQRQFACILPATCATCPPGKLRT